MRRFVYFGLLAFALLSAGILGYLYIFRDSRPVIGCFALDDGIRPRTGCLLNPFRDTSAERKAEAVLQRLREGNIEALLPFLEDLSEDGRNHILDNESSYRIASWRIGSRYELGDNFSIRYWVTRENYAGIEEEVWFQLVRDSGDWKLVDYSAIY